MAIHPDPLTATRQTYERGADGWMASAGAVDRASWSQGYELFARHTRRSGLVLDLGCGPGYDVMGLRARGLNVVGFDVVREFLLANPCTLEGMAVQGDLRTLPFARESFDGVWADGVLHHVPKADVHMILEGIWSLLRPSGSLAMSVERGTGERFAPPEGGIPEPRFYAYYEADELKVKLKAAGFNVVDTFVGGESPRSHGFVSVTAVKA